MSIANRYLTTGRPIVATPMADAGGIDGLVFFGRYAQTLLSPLLQVGENPIVLKAYGLLAGESVAIWNVHGGIEAPYAQLGTPVVLTSVNTSLVLSLVGTYRMVASVAMLGDLLVTATTLAVLYTGEGTTGALRSQVALPNPYLDSSTLSQVAQISRIPWVYRAYGLSTGVTIAVLNVTLRDGAQVVAPYARNGEAVVLDSSTTTIVLDTSGTYQFELTGSPTGVLLIGNETPILYFDPYARSADMEAQVVKAQAAAVAAIAAAAAAAVSAAAAAAAAATFVYDQVIPATVWTITHNLNKYPSVDTVDSSRAAVPGQAFLN
jgi:hypothetical protein